MNEVVMTVASPSKPFLGRSSLQRFLTVVVFLSIATPALVSGGFLILENYNRTTEHDTANIAEGYADLLEAGLSVSLWNVTPELGKPLMDSISLDTSVLSISVTGEQGEIFLEYQREQDAAANPQTIELSRPIIHDNEQLGEVSLVYSLERARARATNEARLLATIIFVQLVVSMVTLSIVLHRRVLSPLNKLGTAATGIAQGDLKTAIPKLKNDEFGGLSVQLEAMRGVLEESFTKLEHRVAERTAELQEVNNTLQGTLDQLRMAQDNLIQQEKLAALGSLVAGVAHELNTPIGNGLTVATTLCDACTAIEKEMQEGLTRAGLEQFIQDMDEGTQLVSRNLEKASELVTSFKQVAMDRTSAQRRTFTLQTILNETLMTVSPTIKRTPYQVKIEVENDAEVELDSYPGPLGQVITNLINNAIIHAFDGRDHGLVVMGYRRVSEGAEIYVLDDGVGIPEENLARIFDPFFTTKLGEGGNGLGMHICHNIVTGILGGQIKVESKVGKGTLFTLTLPRVAPAADEDWNDEQQAVNQ